MEQLQRFETAALHEVGLHSTVPVIYFLAPFSGAFSGHASGTLGKEIACIRSVDMGRVLCNAGHLALPNCFSAV